MDFYLGYQELASDDDHKIILLQRYFITELSLSQPSKSNSRRGKLSRDTAVYRPAFTKGGLNYLVCSKSIWKFSS